MSSLLQSLLMICLDEIVKPFKTNFFICSLVLGHNFQFYYFNDYFFMVFPKNKNLKTEKIKKSYFSLFWLA